MKLKNKISFLATALCVVALCAATGCSLAGKFEVLEVSTPELRGLSSLQGRAVIENRGGRTLIVDNALLTVRYRDRELGRARLTRPVEIPAGSTTDVSYEMAIEGLSLGSVQTLASRMMSNPEDITIDIDGWVHWGRMRKKIELRDVEATRLMGIIF
ncbi:MAG: LEA type 2 family protein [Alistipes sp.]|jgi:LEA14-like dessication related protein|nr:LEA type 2 family protein [Alistipes sp.]